jgi:hypothetical protein
VPTLYSKLFLSLASRKLVKAWGGVLTKALELVSYCIKQVNIMKVTERISNGYEDTSKPATKAQKG